MIDKCKQNIKQIVLIVCIVLTAWMIVTFVSATAYSVLVSDDFGHAARVGIYRVSLWNNIKESINYSKYTYNNWQGTYFSMFLQILISPLNNYGLPQLRLIMVLNSLLFLTGVVILFPTEMVKRIDGGRQYIRAIVAFCACYLLIGYESYHEVFFWYSGAVSYSIPAILLMPGLFFLAKERINGWQFVIAILSGILAMGGSLTIAGIGCYLAVVICINHFVGHKVNIRHLSVLFVWVIFACINSFAPGNFVRHSGMDNTGVHPARAFYDSICMTFMRWNRFCSETDFICVILLVVLCGTLIGDVYVVSVRNYIISAMLALLPVVAVYPVALGYSGQYILNRTAFVIDLSIIISALYISLVAGMKIYNICGKKRRNILIASIGLLSIFCMLLDGYKIENSNIKLMSLMLNEGVYQEHYILTRDFYQRLASFEKGEDVRIPEQDLPYLIKNVQNFYITDNPNSDLNMDVALFYGFNSIASLAEGE